MKVSRRVAALMGREGECEDREAEGDERRGVFRSAGHRQGLKARKFSVPETCLSVRKRNERRVKMKVITAENVCFTPRHFISCIMEEYNAQI